MTPAAQEGSTGGQSKAPTTGSEPRGSLTTADRNVSCKLRNRASRSGSGAAGRTGLPASTTRVGSPPVCESMTSMTRGLGCKATALRSFLLRVEVHRQRLGHRGQSGWVALERPRERLQTLLRQRAVLLI